jgi:hypothetical protein
MNAVGRREREFMNPEGRGEGGRREGKFMNTEE